MLLVMCMMESRLMAKSMVRVCTYADDDVYDGDWVNDTRHGRGVYTFHNGCTFEGGFQQKAFTAGTLKLP